MLMKYACIFSTLADIADETPLTVDGVVEALCSPKERQLGISERQTPL